MLHASYLQIHIDIVLGKLTMQEMEITELSSRSIETSLQVKQVVLKVLDISGTTFETLSAACNKTDPIFELYAFF